MSVEAVLPSSGVSTARSQPDSLTVAVLGDQDESRYQDFYRSAPSGMIYYDWRYRELLIRLLGCTPLYLAAEDESGRIRAVLPLMRAEGPYGAVINSLPFFGSYGGVLGHDAVAADRLWRAYAELTSAPEIVASTVIFNPLADGQPPPVPHDFIDERLGQFTPLGLARDDATLLAAIDASARRNIKTAAQGGVTAGINNGAWAELAEMHRENMTAIGGSTKSDEFFALVPQIFRAGEDYELWIARHGDQVIAALLLFYAGGVVEYFIPATRIDWRSLQPSAAILFAAMRAAADRGFRLWNWGGTWPTQDGVMRFKRKWGAEARPYRYHVRLNNCALLGATREELLAGYKGFYVLPFNALVTERN